METYKPDQEDSNAHIGEKENKTIDSLTDKLFLAAKEKGFPPIYDGLHSIVGVDALENPDVIEGDFSEGAISILKENMTEGDMLSSALKLPLSQAIERLTEEVENGYFDEKWKGLYIYLTDTNSEGDQFNLQSFRDSDGTLRFQIFEVNSANAVNVDSVLDGEPVLGFLQK